MPLTDIEVRSSKPSEKPQKLSDGGNLYLLVTPAGESCGGQDLSGNGRLLLHSIRTVRAPISEGTFNAALRRLGYGKDEMTPHGFRAAASTMLNESGKWSSDAIEHQLGHIDTNDVRRAYARGQYWEERVQMAAWWANYLDQLQTRFNLPHI